MICSYPLHPAEQLGNTVGPNNLFRGSVAMGTDSARDGSWDLIIGLKNGGGWLAPPPITFCSLLGVYCRLRLDRSTEARDFHLLFLGIAEPGHNGTQ